ncbi:MAG: porin family protein [Rhodobacteraceae bacterium]|nr:porin family protein [Paracoccaceae bacterium]
MTNIQNRHHAGVARYFRQFIACGLGAVALGIAGAGQVSANGLKSVAPAAEVAPQYTYAQPVQAQAHDWSGAYAGVGLGYAFGGRDRVALNPPGPGVIGTLRNSGAFGTFQAGMNWQTDDVVYGVEADLTLGNIRSSIVAGANNAAMRIRSAASLRARGGFTSNDDLFYLTGGIAAARVKYVAVGGGANIDRNFNQFGYALGAGWERALNDGLSLRGEYIYSNFGRRSLTDAGLTTIATPDFHALRLGVNQRF